MKIRVLLILAISSIIYGPGASKVLGQAYCALRTPETSIKSMYPEATSFRSIVRSINQSTRESVAANLPSHSLHFGELGRHTLYVALKEQEPIGFVHARSEATKWGLMEIAWAIDMNLRIKDFMLQRCRDRNRSKIETPEFRNALAGLSFDDLKARTVEGFDNLPIPPEARNLTEALLYCGLKTLLTTKLAWGEDIAKIKAHKWFGESITHLKKIAGPEKIYTNRLLENLRTVSIGENTTGLDRETIEMQLFFDETRAVGAIFFADLNISGKRARSTWAVSADTVL